MVVFTCNNCGDSLQKPKVEKHYSMVCPTFKNLTCVDCLHDFKGEDYVAHIKCLSEKERYAAKGAVVNVVNKGEVKQQKWSDMILEVINNKTCLNSSQQLVFDIMSNHINNVPRKKMKFMNFVKNAGGNKIAYADIENVWNLIEEYKNLQSQLDGTKIQEIAVIEQNQELNEKPPKKKKKCTPTPVNKFESASQQIENDEHFNKQKFIDVPLLGDLEKILNPLEAVKSKKKKSKMGKEQINAFGTVIETVETKLKKRKSEPLKSTDIGTEEQFKTEDRECKFSIPKKKKKKNWKPEDGNEFKDNNGDGKTKSEDEIPKEHVTINKKKNTSNGIVRENSLEGNMEIIVDSQKWNKATEASNGTTENSDKSVDPTVKSLFDAGLKSTQSMPEKILNILTKKVAITLIKLQKRVLQEYCQENYLEESPKLVKKFMKQLRKIEGIEISEGTVKLLQH